MLGRYTTGPRQDCEAYQSPPRAARATNEGQVIPACVSGGAKRDQTATIRTWDTELTQRNGTVGRVALTCALTP